MKGAASERKRAGLVSGAGNDRTSRRGDAPGTRIDLKVIPRASRTAIEGVRNGRLVVRVTAPPVDAAANEAVIEALASALDLPRRSLRIVAGATSRNKTIEVASIDAGQVAARLRLPRL